jgi:hypothetical protein
MEKTMKTFHRSQHTALTSLLAAGVLAAALGAPAHAELPPVQRQGNIEYVMGGIGQSESDSMKAAEKNYSLSMVFAQRIGGQNDYAADIPLTIADSKGNTVLQTTVSGPYMLVKLPAGQYKVTATYNNQPQTRTVNIGGAGTTEHQSFEWH